MQFEDYLLLNYVLQEII